MVSTKNPLFTAYPFGNGDLQVIKSIIRRQTTENKRKPENYLIRLWTIEGMFL